MHKLLSVSLLTAVTGFGALYACPFCGGKKQAFMGAPHQSQALLALDDTQRDLDEDIDMDDEDDIDDMDIDMDMDDDTDLDEDDQR